MCEIHGAVLRDDAVARAFVCGHLGDEGELAGSVNVSNREPRISCSAYIEGVSGGRVAEVVHAIARINGRQFFAVVADIQYLS